MHVAVTLWFLATGADYRTPVWYLKVNCLLGCVFHYCQVSATGVDGLKRDLGFPQCEDGSHIPIISPHTDYYKRKGWHSVVLQGAVNHQGHFIDIHYVGWPGGVHARDFSRGQNGNLWIAGEDIPVIMIENPAYPMAYESMPQQWAFEQKQFNYHLSKARVVVEHCYGRLKGWWSSNGCTWMLNQSHLQSSWRSV